LDDAIKHFTKARRKSSRVEGLTSLSDELLARIFELYHEDYSIDLDKETKTCSSSILASVCTRFRHVALRMPSLWEDTSYYFRPKRALLLKSRSQNPRVHIYAKDSAEDHGLPTIRDYIKSLHPNNQWRSLDVQYEYDDDGVGVLREIGTAVQPAFTELESLSLSHLGKDLIDEPESFTSLADIESTAILRRWSLPKLVTLRLMNTLPQYLDCPGLRSSDIDLKLVQSNGMPFEWDSRKLRGLLGSLRTVESLSITLASAGSMFGAVDGPPVQLLSLRSFSLLIKGGTEPRFLRNFSEMVDMPNLSKLDIEMEYANDEIHLLPKWLDALFKYHRIIRTFSNVEDLSIRVRNVSEIKVPFESMFRALPRVRRLSMQLPGFDTRGMFRCKDHGCLRDLRSIHYSNCDSEYLYRFLGELRGGELEQFERLELFGCCKLVDEKPRLERLLGETLIRRT